MQYLKRYRWVYWIITMLMMIVLSGCGPTKIHGLQHHPSFNYDHITTSSIAIGGVTTTLARRMKPGKASYYSELLLEALLQKRPAYRVTASGVLADRLGSEYQRMMARYRDHGVVNIDDLRAIHHLLPNTRYAMFARINQNDVKKRYDESQYIEKHNKKDPNDDELVVTESFVTTRMLSVSLVVYDLIANEKVWSGSVNKSDVETNSDKDEQLLHENWKKSMIDAFVAELLFGGTSHHYPPPIPTHELLKEVFVGFAENMPQAKK